jgi:hypothetical protein
MRCHRLRDAGGAEPVVTAARNCPVHEIACPGWTLHTGQTELLAHFAQPDASWADRILEPDDQERQAHGGPIPQLRQLPAPPTSQPRPNPEQSPDITVRNPRHGLPVRISATRDRIRTGRGDRERADFQCRDIASQGIETPPNDGPPSVRHCSRSVVHCHCDSITSSGTLYNRHCDHICPL